MSKKPPSLDKATAELAKRVLRLPPKAQEDLKVGRPAKEKKREPKGRASSSKPRDA